MVNLNDSLSSVATTESVLEHRARGEMRDATNHLRHKKKSVTNSKKSRGLLMFI